MWRKDLQVYGSDTLNKLCVFDNMERVQGDRHRQYDRMRQHPNFRIPTPEQYDQLATQYRDIAENMTARIPEGFQHIAHGDITRFPTREEYYQHYHDFSRAHDKITNQIRGVVKSDVLDRARPMQPRLKKDDRLFDLVDNLNHHSSAEYARTGKSTQAGDSKREALAKNIKKYA